MGIPVFILGESGSGKSASLRNFNGDDIAIIQSVKKPLPFKNDFKRWDAKSSTGTFFFNDSAEVICKAIEKLPTLGKKIIIVDDFQYVMANEFMRRSAETGFNKFTEIAKHAWEIITAAQNAPDDVRVYFLSHTSKDDQGHSKAKTIGKLLDEKITLEGLFTIVMRAMRIDGKYVFSTQNCEDTTKTPMGMFDNEHIDNDLKMIDDQIKSYYSIGE